METAVKNDLKGLIAKFTKRNKLPQPKNIRYNCHIAQFNIEGQEFSLSYEHKVYGLQWTGDNNPAREETKKYSLAGRLNNKSISLEAQTLMLTIYPYIKFDKKGKMELIPNKPRAENQRTDNMPYWFLTPPNIQ